MKGSKLILFLVILVASFVAKAQDIPLTNKAASLCQSGDLIGARAVVDQALASAEAQHPYTWYVKGYIHKEIYKLIEKQSLHSTNRLNAVVAIKKSMDLDTEGVYRNFNSKALDFLGISFYNDALLLIESFDSDDNEIIFNYYNSFKELMVLSEPFYDFSQFDLDFYKAIAGSYEKIFYHDVEQKDNVQDAIHYYSLALEIDPEDYTSNFNTAIDLYNQGVYKVRLIDYDTEIVELLMIQDECIKLFKQSLPFMLKAHEQTPERRETLVALMAIYRALNDYERSDYFQETLENLIKSGKISEQPNKN
ncbi:MAG: tetratricopeptide (TPR) repeat protein [Flavobacteriales bacterium]|jgi:tetratricopeptide (TPR) repeat protein